METMKKRIDWIDETKGWGILCIMMAHVFQYFQATSFLNAYICSFHVPIFFVVIGCMDFCFQEKKFDLKKRTYALLVPYVVFSIINLVLKIAVFGIMHKLSADMIKNELIEFFITGNGTGWFLLTLWMLNLLTQWGIKRLHSNWMILLVGIMALAVVYSLHLPWNPILVLFLRLIAALGYWALGYAFFSIVDRCSAIGFAGFLLVAAGWGVALMNGTRVDFFSGIFSNGLASIAASLLSSFGYIIIFCWISKKQLIQLLQRFLVFFGKNSLIVMLIHPLWLQCFMYPLRGWFGELTGMESFMMAILVYIVIVLLEVPSIWIMNKYFRVLISKKKFHEPQKILEE